MTDTATPIDLSTVKAEIDARNKALAQHRAPMLAALLTKVQAASLSGIAADFRAIRDAQTSDKDQFVFKLHADVLGTTEQALTDAIAADNALIG